MDLAAQHLCDASIWNSQFSPNNILDNSQALNAVHPPQYFSGEWCGTGYLRAAGSCL